MTCKKCGYEIEISNNFCPNCGAKIDYPEHINYMKESADKIAKMPKKKKSRIVFVLIAVGMICAILGAVFFALNFSKYQSAKVSLNEINSAISAYSGSSVLYQLAQQYYAEQINTLQSTVSHYSSVLLGSGIAIAFGVICAIFSVLYLLTTKSEDNILNGVISPKDIETEKPKLTDGNTPDGTYFAPPALYETNQEEKDNPPNPEDEKTQNTNIDD